MSGYQVGRIPDVRVAGATGSPTGGTNSLSGPGWPGRDGESGMITVTHAPSLTVSESR